jgi:phosphoglycerate dehydrogenase-like enzyme
VLVALEPNQPDAFVDAITSAGGQVCRIGPEIDSLVWTDYHQPEKLKHLLEQNPQLTWVQLPFAGVDAFAQVLQHPVTFTCAKAAYSQPVAEHALALMLALGRAIPERVLAATWGQKFAVSLYESRVLIIGGGGIAQELLKLLKPFGCEVTVVRKNSTQQLSSAKTVNYSALDEQLPKVDFVVIAAALTNETTDLFNLERISKMKPSAYLVNIARGRHIVTDDLVRALISGVIAGAALDVTHPEPLPDGHPLWSMRSCIITPHTADTPEQVTRMLAQRIFENVRAKMDGLPMIGVVDKVAGY